MDGNLTNLTVRLLIYFARKNAAPSNNGSGVHPYEHPRHERAGERETGPRMRNGGRGCRGDETGGEPRQSGRSDRAIPCDLQNLLGRSAQAWAYHTGGASQVANVGPVSAADRIDQG